MKKILMSGVLVIAIIGLINQNISMNYDKIRFKLFDLSQIGFATAEDSDEEPKKPCSTLITSVYSGIYLCEALDGTEIRERLVVTYSNKHPGGTSGSYQSGSLAYSVYAYSTSIGTCSSISYVASPPNQPAPGVINCGVL